MINLNTDFFIDQIKNFVVVQNNRTLYLSFDIIFIADESIFDEGQNFRFLEASVDFFLQHDGFKFHNALTIDQLYTFSNVLKPFLISRLKIDFFNYNKNL
jgi:hypothetical protein